MPALSLGKRGLSRSVCPDSGLDKRKAMNQMLQAPQNSQTTAPPARSHPRFAKPQRIAFVQASWHREVGMECQTALLTEAEARDISRAAIDIFEVPGSFEIPRHAQILAKTRRYPAIVAAGLVVDVGI